MSSSRKRKHGSATAHNQSNKTSLPTDIATGRPDPDPALFIQAHEADLIHGPQARTAARSLEVIVDRTEEGRSRTKDRRWNIGDGLIRWGGTEVATQTKENSGMVFHDEDDYVQGGQSKDGVEVWVDRYDARLLLDALPTVPSVPVESNPGSPTGWSDLPSDTEDMFFFAPAEVEDYRREKRRRMIDRDREERLKAMHAEEGDDGHEVWGESDEEPDETQKELMRRTATHILSSPNHAQLEMRILANHGRDKRFAFLRGRWSRSWKMIKGRARMDKDEKEKEKKAGVGLGGLAGYGDSEDEEEANGVDEATNSPNRGQMTGKQPDDPVKEARRARARTWAEKRRHQNG